MSLRSRGLAVALAFGIAASLAGEARSAMTLEFNINPTTQPHSGSLDKDASGTVVATNLAVTSVSSVQTNQIVPLSKYLDLQTAGATGSNFFILDGAVQQYAGTAPAAMTSPATSTTLVASATGYLLTMIINNGFVSNQLAADFGLTGGFGWKGVLTLNIAAFNPALGSDQVTSGTLFLTSPAAETTVPTMPIPLPDPIPAGEGITAAVVPEPSSFLMAGMGLALAAARFRAVARRPRA